MPPAAIASRVTSTGPGSPTLNISSSAELGGKGAAWVTLTPDGKTAYVANPVTNDVSVVDIKSMKETTRIPVGFVPKRNTTGILP